MLEDSESDVFVDKELYYKELETFYTAHKKNLKKPWTSARVEEITEILITSRQPKAKGEKRTNEQHYFSRIYESMEIGGEKTIIKKRSSKNDEITFVVPYEKLYEILVETHMGNGHGGRDKMLMSIKHKYSIPRSAVEIFVKCCRTCVEKKQQPKKGIVVKPIISKGWNHRGQVDLMDLQSTPDGEYKWLMNYQDHLTKFLHLRPLTSKRATEVSSELLKIFLEFGAPKILQSDNGREFVNSVIDQLVSKWPSCKIVNGRPRHPQSQGSVERSNQDVENMLKAWLKDNNSTNWSLGCYFVQWQKNSSYHRIIKRTPYKALFGVDFPVGLYSSNLPRETVKKLTTEEDLEKLLTNIISEEENITEEEDLENLTIMSFETNKCSEEVGLDNLIAISCETNQSANEMNQNEELHLDDNPTGLQKSIIDIEEIQIFNVEDIPIVEQIVTENKVCCVNCLKISSSHLVLNETAWICDLCQREDIIHAQRMGCVAGQKRAAEEMLQNTNQKLKPLFLGQNIAVEVPKFDRGPLDPKNILGTIVEIKNGVYQVGTKHGILNRWFSRDEIIGIENPEPIKVLEGTMISLREALTKFSKFGGQGFKKCSCKASKTQCHRNKCFCFKAHLKCNSKCHSSGPCLNK